MIEGKKIKFGYGDVAVGAIFNNLSFRWFEPAQECGTAIRTEVKWLSEPFYINFEGYDDIAYMKRYLIGIKNKDITEFEMGGYVLNFENYNEKSVEVMLKHLKKVEDNFTFLSAA